MSQSEQRRAAAKAFQESLNHLQNALQPADSATPSVNPAARSSTPSTGQNGASNSQPPLARPLTFDELEAAAADIEQFMQEQETQETEET
jgi:hypothetical protein